jgi:hypothetical protein
VAALRETGRVIYPINPLAASHYRSRYAVSGAKSDATDAVLLANIIRTDPDAHRPLPADTELAQASLANKDGGAHVDAKLEAYYKVLCAGEYALGITGNLTYAGPPPFPQGVIIYPDNAHLALARQFAHETLASQSYFGWPVA